MAHRVLEFAESSLGLRLASHGDVTLLDGERRMLLISRAKKFPQPDEPWLLQTVAAAKELVAKDEVLVTGADRIAYDAALWTVREHGGKAIVVLDEAVESQPLPPRTLFVWPQLPTAGQPPHLRDRIIAALCSRATSIHIRDAGVMSELAASLRARGVAIEPSPALDTPPAAPPPADSPAPPGAIVDDAEISEWNLLTHFTRDPDAPWPGETRGDHLRWLCSGPRTPHRDAFTALCRILHERRLRACGRLIPGGTPMVCFTARRPADVAPVTYWRRGFNRWTFTNYALALPRHYLAQHDAREVRYVSREVLDATSSADDAKFMQLERSGEIDWRLELEWRVAGDLDFSHVKAGVLIACVAHAREAAHLYRTYGVRSVIAPAKF